MDGTAQNSDQPVQPAPSKRHIFDIWFRDRLCPVYDIQGKEHNHGKWNGEPATWWVDIGVEVAKNTGVRIENLVEYHNKSIARPCWDIRIKEINHYKVKWDEDRWSSNTSCEMWANGKLIYGFVVRDIEFAMAKAQVLMIQLTEHPFNFFDQKKEEGRKIWWYYEPGNIKIRPDYATMDKETWWKKYHERAQRPGEDDEFENWEDRMGDYKTDDLINWGDALSDQHIYWFRK